MKFRESAITLLLALVPHRAPKPWAPTPASARCAHPARSPDSMTVCTRWTSRGRREPSGLCARGARRPWDHLLERLDPRPLGFLSGAARLVTGGSPVSHQVFYDVSYDARCSIPPTRPAPDRPETPSSTTRASTSTIRTTSPSTSSIREAAARSGRARKMRSRLSPQPAQDQQRFSKVVKAAGGPHAWADKHPAYDLVNGPSGRGVDDLFTPEITKRRRIRRDRERGVHRRERPTEGPGDPQRDPRPQARRLARGRRADRVSA